MTSNNMMKFKIVVFVLGVRGMGVSVRVHVRKSEGSPQESLLPSHPVGSWY